MESEKVPKVNGGEHCSHSQGRTIPTSAAHLAKVLGDPSADLGVRPTATTAYPCSSFGTALPFNPCLFLFLFTHKKQYRADLFTMVDRRPRSVLPRRHAWRGPF